MDNVFGKTLSASRSLYVDDLTIGTVTITLQYSTVPYQLQLPPTQGITNSFLTNNGSGILTWRDETTLPYIEEVGISVPSFLTVTNSPITPTSLSSTIGITYSNTPLPIANGGTGLTTVATVGKVLQSNGTAIVWSDTTGTGSVVLQTAPTFTTSITTPQINNPGSGLDLTLSATGPFSDLIISSTNGIIQVNAPSIFIGGNKYPIITGNSQDVLETDGLGNLSWSGTTGNGNVVKANNATMDNLTLDTPLTITSGGTGLDTVGPSGSVLMSNGTSLEWSATNLLGVMRYKQTYFNPYEDPTPPDAQIWPSYSTIDLRTLHPVAGAQYGLALTYGYEANFGRFVNDYDFAVKVEIQFSLARYVETIPMFILPGTPYQTQIESVLAFFSTVFTGQSLFWIEKNDDGDVLAAQGGSGGAICSGSFTLILQPDDFFQFRGYNNAAGFGKIGNECEVAMNITSLAGVPGYLPPAPGTGTVDSVNIGTSNAFLTTGGGPITTTGTLTVGLSGSALPIANGGTGLTTVGTVGKVLQSNGAAIAWSNTTGTGAVTLSTAPTFTTEITTPAIKGAVNLAITATNFSTVVTGDSFNTCVGIYTLLSDNYTFFGSRSYLDIRGGFEGTNDIFLSSTRSIFIDAPSSIRLGGNTYPLVTGTNGYVLTTNGAGTTSWQPAPGAGGGGGTGTVTSVGLTSSTPFITVSGATITTSGFFDVNIGTLGVANGGTGSTAASTGTGGVVLRTSPTFTTSLITPKVTGSGTLNDLDLASTRNVTITCGASNAIIAVGNLYLRSKIVGNTGGDFIIENQNSYIFLNPAYSVRTGGMALHAESANNQTFTGTVIGDQTIRSDSNLWLGPGGFSKTQLIGAAGIYANGTRLDSRGFAVYTGGPALTSASSPYKPPNTAYTNGTILTYSSSTGNFTNNTGGDVLIEAAYSFKQIPGGGPGPALRVTNFWVEVNGNPVEGSFFAANTVTTGDWASGAAVFFLTNGDFFRYGADATDTTFYDSKSSASYSLRSL